ncbi:MAG: methionyl-tRNA formyltransferase [Parcubacteria group bacterium CG_4_9_14_0_2_um_filter_41_8]|nr:MAG: methionyl-tRNA formyltransferase [Parcubacteria group bacterium CG1_02_41_12]PIR56821.1 MAG: methionyl-tRNA formyltransferase [Parcubacteria group bacterium CG10_big_fil_rev_8_21_14_0_10_41_35]PJC40291.1 MAG: methionyl-tRNA formyltransferase [Parcubacteria group bacterium CG_4_9_14_0_2_um_filter_41_8]
MKDKVKIIFFGTPEFAVPTLKALINAPFCEVQKVVTQKDKPVGRHHSKLVPCAVKRVAQEEGLPVIHETPPQSLPWQGGRYDLGMLVAYGEIIPKKIIDSFPLGILNLHPSLLPKYRGSSPIQAAILNQDKETGVTIMKLDDKMDHGPIIAQETINLNQTETAGDLQNKLAQTGADLLIKILPDYIAGKITPRAQNETKAISTKKLAKQDAKIDWNSTAHPPEPLIRAMNPWPGAWTTWRHKKLIIWSMDIDGTPKELQLEGKKKMPYSEFLKGHPGFSTHDCV